MSGHKVNLLGMEIAFRAEVSSERVEKARQLIESRYTALAEQGRSLSRERLLILMALSIADDFLEIKDKNEKIDSDLQGLLHKIN